MAESFEQRYEKLVRRRWIPSTFVDEEFLRTKGMYDEIEGIVTAAGWPGLMTLRSDTDVEDASEFLASFVYEGRRQLDGFRYRHRGEQRRCTMMRLREVFGWSEVITDIEDTGSQQNHQVWSELTGGKRYRSGYSNIRDSLRPSFWYLQKLISHNITGRHNGSEKPNMLDMTIMRGFFFGRVPDYAHVMCKHWQSVTGRGPVGCGGMITYLLRSLHGLPVLPEHNILPAFTMDRARVIDMGGVSIRRNTGEVFWDYHPEEELERIPRRRRRVADGHGEDQQADIPVPPQPQPVLDERVLLFQLGRVMDHMAADGRIVYPPADWQPGQPIPEQYRLPARRGAGDDGAGPSGS